MTGIRLFNTKTSTLETFQLESRPPYLAVSHAWSDQFFPPGIPILDSPGGEVILKVIETRFPAVHHCWVDNFCILQDDDDDKAAQIPHMGRIYHDAAAVIIALKCELGFNQEDVDIATRNLAPALKVWNKVSRFEKDQIRYWKYGSGRKILAQAMNGLARFVCPSWATRVWTLQEYILASEVVWIGSDLNPVTIDDELFIAIPYFCSDLGLRRHLLPSETLNPQSNMLFSHFHGMANARLGMLEKTRVMELLSNRKATMETDEVYGIMASSGVEIDPIWGETKEEAWERWCEAAVVKGHLRWIMLPPSPPSSTSSNCALVAFDRRGWFSASALIDSVMPQGTIEPTVQNGTFTVTGRRIGSCELICRLGTVHHSESDQVYLGLSIVLLSKGLWNLALKIIRSLSPGHYSERQHVAIAQVMTNNYFNALSSVRNKAEPNFEFRTREFQEKTWNNFVEFLNRGPEPVGVGYLAKIRPNGLQFEIPIFINASRDIEFGVRSEEHRLEVLDFAARTPGTRVFMVVQGLEKRCETPLSSTVDNPLHKVGTTVQVPSAYDALWEELPLQRFSIGGKGCRICGSGKEPQMAPPLQKTASRKEQELMELKRKWRLRLRREWLVRRGILSRPRHFMRFGKHRLWEDVSD